MAITNSPEFTWILKLFNGSKQTIKGDRLSITDQGTLIAFRLTHTGTPVVIFSSPAGEWTELSMVHPGTGLPLIDNGGGL